jgi:serine/threonine protein kinase
MKNKNYKPLQIEQARFFIRQLSECLKYMHSFSTDKESVVHRDLKLENIIIDENFGEGIYDLLDFKFRI